MTQRPEAHGSSSDSVERQPRERLLGRRGQCHSASSVVLPEPAGPTAGSARVCCGAGDQGDAARRGAELMAGIPHARRGEPRGVAALAAVTLLNPRPRSARRRRPHRARDVATRRRRPGTRPPPRSPRARAARPSGIAGDEHRRARLGSPVHQRVHRRLGDPGQDAVHAHALAGESAAIMRTSPAGRPCWPSTPAGRARCRRPPAGEPTQTIAPPPAASSARAPCLAVRNAPVRLTSTVRLPDGEL